jgi:hypothetical protein
MKKLTVNLMLVLLMLSCTQKQKGASLADTSSTPTTKKDMAESNSGPFDLAKLSLKEKLTDLLAPQSIKPEKNASSEQTLFGLEVFKSSDPKVLRFGGQDLFGGGSTGKNEVLFHYNPKDNMLAFYELRLYSKKQTDALISELNKNGKPAFEKIKTTDGAIELDENGNEVKASKSDNKKYHVWENKATGVSYFLIETGTGEKTTAELTALRSSEQYGKDWISFRSFNWYKN